MNALVGRNRNSIERTMAIFNLCPSEWVALPFGCGTWGYSFEKVVVLHEPTTQDMIEWLESLRARCATWEFDYL
jgi:hypothetical protein